MITVLSQQAFLSLCATGKTVSSHGVYGPKVVLLPSGEYLKVFLPKSGLTKRRFFPKYKKFIRNAEHLQACGVPTVQVTQIFAIPEQASFAVQYLPLAGTALRSIMQQSTQNNLEDLISFLVLLHEKGIFFRGIHLGNIVQVKEKTFGLIDMADLSFKSGPLGIFSRVRNLVHLLNNKDDAWVYEKVGVERFLDEYAHQAHLSGWNAQLFYALIKLFQRYKSQKA